MVEQVPTIYRYEVPVDDRWHTVELTGQVLHVAARQPEKAEFWATANTEPPRRRRFRVFGTGQPLPDALVPTSWSADPPTGCYTGTALAAGGRLVWHLYEAWGEGGDDGQ